VTYPYLIEVRLRDDVKTVTKKLIFDIYHKFGVRGAIKRRPVPHISLFGPFNTRSVKEVIAIMRKVGSSYSSLDYEISGFGYFQHIKWSFIIPHTKKNVIHLKIKLDPNFQKFRDELAKELIPKTKSQDAKIDSISGFVPHATLAMKDIHQKFEDIWDYLKMYDIKTKGVCYRITLMNRGKIVCEYDLVQKRILNRREALSGRGWRLTAKLSNVPDDEDDTQMW